MRSPQSTSDKSVEGDCCRCCGKPHSDDEPLTIEHRQPRGFSGSDDADNLDWACVSCNSSKLNTAGCSLDGHDRVLVNRTSLPNPNAATSKSLVRSSERKSFDDISVAQLLRLGHPVLICVSQYHKSNGSIQNYRQDTDPPEPDPQQKWWADIVVVFDPIYEDVFFYVKFTQKKLKEMFAETGGGLFCGIIVKEGRGYSLSQEALTDEQKARCKDWWREHIKGSNSAGYWLKGDDEMAPLFLMIYNRRRAELLRHEGEMSLLDRDRDMRYLKGCWNRYNEAVGTKSDLRTPSTSSVPLTLQLPPFDGDLTEASVQQWLNTPPPFTRAERQRAEMAAIAAQVKAEVEAEIAAEKLRKKCGLQ